MAERYAAHQYDVGNRHRGSRIGTLWFDEDCISGDATISADFLELTPIERADVLQDIIGVLQREYEFTLIEMTPRKFRNEQ